MKTSLLGFLIVVSAGSQALATAEFRAGKSPCAEMQSALNSFGSIVIHYRFGYNIYFANPRDCAPGTQAVAAFDRASDKALCRLGYFCSAPGRNND